MSSPWAHGDHGGHGSGPNDHGSVTARSQLNHGPGHGSVTAGWDHFGHRELTVSSWWAHCELTVSSHGGQFFSHGFGSVIARLPWCFCLCTCFNTNGLEMLPQFMSNLCCQLEYSMMAFQTLQRLRTLRRLMQWINIFLVYVVPVFRTTVLNDSWLIRFTW